MPLASSSSRTIELYPWSLKDGIMSRRKSSDGQDAHQDDPVNPRHNLKLSTVSLTSSGHGPIEVTNSW